MLEASYHNVYNSSEQNSPQKRKVTTDRCTRAIPSSKYTNTSITTSPTIDSPIAMFSVASDSRKAMSAGFCSRICYCSIF